LQKVSRLLERGKLVAWFQGRAEFGHPFNGSRASSAIRRIGTRATTSTYS
jgi:hypothetical protein